MLLTLYLDPDARAARGEAERKADDGRRFRRQARVVAGQRRIECIKEQHAALPRANPPDGRAVRRLRLHRPSVPAGVGMEGPAGFCQRGHPCRFVEVDRLIAGGHQTADRVAVRMPSMRGALEHSHRHTVMVRVCASVTPACAYQCDGPAD